MALVASLPPIALTMAKIFSSLGAGLLALSLGLTRAPAPRGKARGAVWLSTNPGKRAGELLALQLSPLWIASVGAPQRRRRVVERESAGALSGQLTRPRRSLLRRGRRGRLLPALGRVGLHELLPRLRAAVPAVAHAVSGRGGQGARLGGGRGCAGRDSRPYPPQGVPWYARYTFKANAWIAIFSFIGNYWCAAPSPCRLQPIERLRPICTLDFDAGTRTTSTACSRLTTPSRRTG
jgi:hypothetical protein